jgi:hypothetical protein
MVRYMKPRPVVALACALTLTSIAQGDDTEARIAALQNQMNAMQQQVEQIRQQSAQGGSLANAVDRAIVDASKQQPAVGLYKDGFIIASSPEFNMKLNGLLQPRYISNFGDNDTPGTDEDENGFQMRRAELYLSGTAFDPKLSYMFAGGFDRTTGNFQTVYAWVNYQATKQWGVRAGAMKAPFLVEELTIAGKQQVIDRSLATCLLTAGIVEGVQAQYVRDNWTAAMMVHDGSNSVSSDFMNDNTDFGLAGRVEYFIDGNPKQFCDFEGWSDTVPGTRLGAAIDYEQGESGGAEVPDQFKYTADVTYKRPNWSVFAAGIGKHTEDAAGDDVNQYAVQLQGGYFAIPDKLELYTRYEHLWLDGLFGSTAAVDDQLDVVTLGVNYFFYKHSAKLTFDVGYLFDAVPSNVSGVGVLASPGGPQVIVRAGVQLAF